MSGEWELGPVALVATIEDFCERVRRVEPELNALNVFPVADNDTGTNMRRTIEGILELIGDASSHRFDRAGLARAIGDGALDGRGNSGLIVGQFLAGLAVAVADAADLAAALGSGADAARRAVVDPVEGTILTVLDAVSAAARQASSSDPEELRVVAADAVAATPSQLAALGGSIDSGAAGVALFFDALAAALAIRDGRFAHHVDGDPIGFDPGDLVECEVGLDSVITPEPPDRRVVGHELRFRIPPAVVDPDTVRSLLVTVGTDVVVAASADGLAAHVHVDDPHLAADLISGELERRPGVGAISYDVEPLLEHGR